MKLPDAFVRKLAPMYGGEGAAWLASLPALIAEYEERWELVAGSPFELSYNYVAAATRSDGSAAVLKLGPHPDLQWEIAALRAYGARGAVALLESDTARRVMLLERVTPGTRLAEVEDDDEATAIGAGIMGQLCVLAPAGVAFPTLADWAKALPQLRQRFGGSTGPLPCDLVEQAESLFVDLLASQDDVVLLHGDVHHENILRAERQPWLAIDPHGVVGDRGYEAGTFLRNHLMQMADRKRVLARRVDQLAERLEYDRDRLVCWGIAHNVLSACWSTENGGSDWEFAIEVARMLTELR